MMSQDNVVDIMTKLTGQMIVESLLNAGQGKIIFFNHSIQIGFWLRLASYPIATDISP
jgi:hypothetical protein